jgi:hypothetical protein
MAAPLPDIGLSAAELARRMEHYAEERGKPRSAPSLLFDRMEQALFAARRLEHSDDPASARRLAVALQDVGMYLHLWEGAMWWTLRRYPMDDADDLTGS